MTKPGAVGCEAWLIDGFNLYHAICALEKEGGGQGLRWLNPLKLAKACLKDGYQADVWHFTATPHHLKSTDPEALNAHLAYQRALTALRPKVNLVTGVFRQEKVIRRDRDGRTGRWSEWREKGTDVSLAIRAVSLAGNRLVGGITVVSGDSDFAPLATLFRENYPRVPLRFAFPPGRFSQHLARLAPGSFTLGRDALVAAKMDEAVRLPSGKKVVCPNLWK